MLSLGKHTYNFTYNADLKDLIAETFTEFKLHLYEALEDQMQEMGDLETEDFYVDLLNFTYKIVDFEGTGVVLEVAAEINISERILDSSFD